jgi:hypothetical protein
VNRSFIKHNPRGAGRATKKRVASVPEVEAEETSKGKKNLALLGRRKGKGGTRARGFPQKVWAEKFNAIVVVNSREIS